MDDSIDNSKTVAVWWRTLPERQQRIVPVAVLTMLIAGGWLISQRTGAESVVLLPKSIGPAAAVAHLHERGLVDARLNQDGKLVVLPAGAVRARQYVDELAAVSTSWADEWEKTNAQLGQFSGNRERETAREIARARMIGRLLRQMPGVSQADVVWDEEETAGWRGPQKTRCTVYLRPRAGFEINADMVRSVRQAVAGSKKHLAAADIVVMDLDRMTTFDAVPAGVNDIARTLAERDVVEVRQQIETALRDCPGVRVNVDVTWQERVDEPTIALSPVANRSGSGRQATLISSNGFLDELGRDDESVADGQFAPSLQVTVTAPEDAAARWANQTTSLPTTASRSTPSRKETQDLMQVGFDRPVKTRAADTIRQSVCSVLSRFDRRNLATGVSVHLTPAAGTAVPLETIPEAPAIDPLWFIVLAIAGCAAGAWILSSAFSADVLAVESHPLVADAFIDNLAPADDSAEHNSDLFHSNTRSIAEAPEFEELIDCDSALWQQLWETTNHSDWVAALRGSSSQLRRAVLASLETGSAAELGRLLASTPTLRLTEIDTAQQSLRYAAAGLMQRDLIGSPRS